MAGIDATSASARMNQYERGKHTPDFALMQRLGRLLGVPASWFYTDDEDLARLQEIHQKLPSAARKLLLEIAEQLCEASTASPPPSPRARRPGKASPAHA